MTTDTIARSLIDAHGPIQAREIVLANIGIGDGRPGYWASIYDAIVRLSPLPRTRRRHIETAEETAARDAKQREFEASALREDARRRAVHKRGAV